MKTPTSPVEVISGGAMVSLLGEQACFCPQPGSQLLMTRDRDTFRQSRKTATNFTASEHTTDLGGPVVPLTKHREPRGKRRKSNRHSDAT